MSLELQIKIYTILIRQAFALVLKAINKLL